MARIELEAEYITKYEYHVVLDLGELEGLQAILFYYRDTNSSMSPARKWMVNTILEHIKRMDRM